MWINVMQSSKDFEIKRLLRTNRLNIIGSREGMTDPQNMTKSTIKR